MWSVKTLLIAAPVAAGLLAAPSAHADWRHRGGGWGGHERHHDRGGNGALTGALVGLGVAALIGGVIASQTQYGVPPPVTYAPPPSYYPPPVYAAPAYAAPVYAAPPPAYYGPSYYR